MASENHNKKYNSITLDEWVKIHYSEEEMQAVFLNLDIALKYIHKHNYCIEVFYPTHIEILNDNVNYIQFKNLIELPTDSVLRNKMIKEDIFNSSLVQIGIYSKCLKYLKPDYLKENFDSFVQFLPNGDVPYYRGVIQRGASTYLCEYALEKRKRDLQELEKQLGDNNDSDYKLNEKNIENDKINDLIYRQINGIKDRAAFINILIIPLIMLLILLIYEIIVYLV